MAVIIALGIMLATSKPAYAADDPNSETVSDGIVTMTMQRSSSDLSWISDYLFETTITIDARDLTFDDGQELGIDFSPLGMENVAHDETDPTVSIDGGAFHDIDDDNIVGFSGAIEGRGLHGSIDAEDIQGHVVTIKVWNDNTFDLDKGSICNPLTVEVPASSTHDEATYSCDIDIQISGGFYVVWDDDDDAAGKRPDRNDYFAHLSAYADGNPLTYTELTVNYPDSEEQPEGSTNVCAEYGTALTAHGESVEFTFEQEPVDYYTTTPTSGIVSAGETLTNTLATSTTTSGELTVTLKDAASGSPLAGGVYELRDATGDSVAEYTTDENGTFILDPTSTALASAMPAANETASFTLVETSAPEGYDLDTTAHEMTVSLSEDLDTSTLVRTRTYTFTIGNQSTEAISLTNTKTTQAENAEQTSDDSTGQEQTSDNGKQGNEPEAGTLPYTADSLTPIAAALGIAVLSGGALAMAHRLRREE
jgi:hypothetical protein